MPSFIHEVWAEYKLNNLLTVHEMCFKERSDLFSQSVGPMIEYKASLPQSNSTMGDVATSSTAGRRVVGLASSSPSQRPGQTLEWPEKRLPSIPRII